MISKTKTLLVCLLTILVLSVTSFATATLYGHVNVLPSTVTLSYTDIHRCYLTISNSNGDIVLTDRVNTFLNYSITIDQSLSIDEYFTNWTCPSYISIIASDGNPHVSIINGIQTQKNYDAIYLAP